MEIKKRFWFPKVFLKKRGNIGKFYYGGKLDKKEKRKNYDTIFMVRKTLPITLPIFSPFFSVD